jgi:ABC-type proline/glycine betaine transport system ATPase subunit
MNTPFSFVFIGRSGCGKGTQVALLQEYLQKHYSEFPIFYLVSVLESLLDGQIIIQVAFRILYMIQENDNLTFLLSGCGRIC